MNKILPFSCLIALLIFASLSTAQPYWQQNGLEGKFVNEIRFYSNDDIYPSGFNGIWHSTNLGASWTTIDSVDQGEINGFYNTSSTEFYSGFYDYTNFYLRRSTNGGQSWTSMQMTPGMITSISADWVTTPPTLMVSSERALYKGLANGSALPVAQTVPGRRITTVFQISGFAMIGTDSGGVFRYVHTTNTLTPCGLTGRMIYSFAYASAFVYAATDSGIYRSNNLTSWQAVGPRQSIEAISSSSIGTTNYVLYAGFDTTIIRSTDAGTTWTPYATGLGGQQIRSIAYQSTSGYLYASTFGDGIYRTRISLGVDEGMHHMLPVSIVIAKNYPNPFNPTTTIQYSLPKRSEVSVNVFDASGRSVATLFTGIQQQGEQRLIFDGSKLTSGEYIFQIKTNSGSTAKSMLLLK